MSRVKKTPRKLERRQIWQSIYGTKYAEGICYYCIKLTPNIIRDDNYEVGHIEAKSKGGSEHPDNKLPICRDCNSMADIGTKFMDLNRYKFPKYANHAHNPNKVYIKPQRDYTPMDSNVKLIMENSVYNDDSEKNKPVPYVIAKHISDHKFNSWDFVYKKDRNLGKIIIEIIGNFDVNILSPKKCIIDEKKYNIISKKEMEDKDLEMAKKYNLISDYTRRERGMIDDADIQYIIDNLWDSWYIEHKKYGTTNNVTLINFGTHKVIKYCSQYIEEAINMDIDSN